MLFQRRRVELKLSGDVEAALERTSRSRTEPARWIERAKILLHYACGATVWSIARVMHTHRPKVERCINKALQLGPLTALEDMPRGGRPV